ncbi:hypothetical protein BJ875DRAFT_441008 [Amylocarpus encephaloides]|uniref:FAR1 domain-containing protein n=1 Tax=Amylocarpus encephaloides TaxID=45428 RepID=A0A9P8C5J5_9HELO|nr:hypothetical protein BJ875DRAFT_441008 [Amylocarpus encephaloides]
MPRYLNNRDLEDSLKSCVFLLQADGEPHLKFTVSGRYSYFTATLDIRELTFSMEVSPTASVSSPGSQTHHEGMEPLSPSAGAAQSPIPPPVSPTNTSNNTKMIVGSPRPDIEYDTEEAAYDSFVNWAATCWGPQEGFQPVKKNRFKKGGKKDGETYRVIWACRKEGERDGRNKDPNIHPSKARANFSRKSNCPYKVECRRTKAGRWLFHTLEEAHNHAPLNQRDLPQRRLALTTGQKLEIVAMHASGDRPGRILETLKARNGDKCLLTTKDIDNILQKARLKLLRREDLSNF